MEKHQHSLKEDANTFSETKHHENIIKEKQIILYNDDMNSFDFVIETLIDVCQHEATQAEQCAFITHSKGKCSVKTGDNSILIPISKELLRRGLSVKII